jgi:hypothetical protein
MVKDSGLGKLVIVGVGLIGGSLPVVMKPFGAVTQI